MDTFDYSQFIKCNHDLSSVLVNADCGKYRVEIRTYDFVRFDHILTNTSHKHEHYEICLILDGEGVYQYEGKTYHVSAGDLLLADSNTLHELSCYESKHLYLVFFFFAIEQSDIPLTNKQEDWVLHNFMESHKGYVKNANILFHYLPLLVKGKDGDQRRDLSQAITTKAWFFDCISMLSDNLVDHHTHQINNENVDMAVSYIMDHIDTSIKIADVAKHAYVSERHLSNLFKRYYRMSVTEFIKRRKIDIAESKLRMGFKVKEAAAAVGIYNAAQFSKLFKSLTSLTPKQYSDLVKQVK